ncbi:MAG TPA: DUF4157 domain-containing protein [Gammaproteobacteria bacterium]
MRVTAVLVALGISSAAFSQTELLAPALSQWIVSERDAAVARGVEPIPPDVRKVLTGYVAEGILEVARWRVDDTASSGYPAFFRMGAAPAVTLDYVVVFDSAEHAADPTLWAHELYHVRQYRDWGLAGFAERYLADYEAVEHDAAEFRWQWMKATGRVPPP